MNVRHASIKFDVTARSKKGNSVKFSAYCACAKVRAADGKIFDFRRKAVELRGHAIMLPEGAPAWANGPELWRRAEAAEKRSDAQTSRVGRVEIPRQVPENLQLDFARYIAQPWCDDGMAIQINVHCSEASDGDPKGNSHIHYMMTFRRFDGDGFAHTKETQWNIDFRAKEPGSNEKGTAMRAQVAARANEWLEAHGIDVRVDHRKRADGIPAERDISKRSWEAWKKDKESAAAAPVREVLEGRQLRRQLRHAQNATAHYSSAASAFKREIGARQPGIRSPGWQKQPFTWDARWSPKPEGYVSSVEIHDRYAAINLNWGAQIRDFGSRITVAGKADWRAAMALADHAARKGLNVVEVTGDAKFRAALAAQLAARGIEVTNERRPSAYAIAQAKELSAKAMAPKPIPKPEPGRQEPPKPRPPTPQPEPTTGPKAAPGYVPPWVKDPGWTSKKKDNEGGRP